MNKNNSASTSYLANKANYKYLVFCSIACLLVFAFGGVFQPGEWYAQINKAPWSPPNIAFPIVWSFLYICIAVAGWKIFTQEIASLKILWLTQLIFNGLWSWVFFGEKWVLLGLIDIGLIIALVTALILKSWPTSRLSSVLLMPYLAWLLLASSLNLYILLAN